ncbi:MAG: DUF3306 domain-containing protein [Boseongicola sp. SB0676_bin_33]|uniref:DUF3306 domain-containing protein n=1 Tax=Boseongicola sp. SB0664_bin_43 TaxID=2604844 RepID=A0A6B0XWG8_9RHOB|nr:DUF3306 domain-containing protein [Boseongicola sp. SB0664_bin_43]MYF88617.1 DUF3306 domain-containing protein [Boseongicola sp. SB0676_bin_33]MYK32538.1 DUF3306 domain-containing protein [Boseongicola sp. SB0670_bin_30]
MNDFWERRKAAVRAEEAAEERAKSAADEAEEQARLSEKSDEEVLRELDLPDPDSLAAGDDFSIFLKKTVPERIRIRALRRLWTTNPLLANLDGLVDYGEDFTDAATVIESLQTAYRVGEGMARHVAEMARQAEAATDDEETDASESPAEDPADAEADEVPDNLPRNQIAPAIEECEQDSRIIAEKSERNGVKPRRMSYHFDERQSSK